MKKLLLMAVFAVTCGAFAAELDIKGDFKAPKTPGKPPVKWNFTSGSKGTLEIITTADGNSVMLSADAGMRFGIYSPPVAAKAGDKVKISAFVRGEKVIFGIFQYGTPAGSSAQRQTLAASAEGKKIEAVFTVADTKKGKTDRIRVCFMVEKDDAASISDVKAEIIE